MPLRKPAKGECVSEVEAGSNQICQQISILKDGTYCIIGWISGKQPRTSVIWKAILCGTTDSGRLMRRLSFLRLLLKASPDIKIFQRDPDGRAFQLDAFSFEPQEKRGI